MESDEKEKKKQNSGRTVPVVYVHKKESDVPRIIQWEWTRAARVRYPH